VIYFSLIWLELLSGGLGATPKYLSIFLLIYLSITIIGSIIFGMKSYFEYGDFFNLFFGLLSQVSIFEYDSNSKKLYLRPPFVGLLKLETRHFSLLIFILFMLSSTAYDGFKSSSTWLKFYFSNFSYLNNYFGDNALQ